MPLRAAGLGILALFAVLAVPGLVMLYVKLRDAREQLRTTRAELEQRSLTDLFTDQKLHEQARRTRDLSTNLQDSNERITAHVHDLLGELALAYRLAPAAIPLVEQALRTRQIEYEADAVVRDAARKARAGAEFAAYQARRSERQRQQQQQADDRRRTAATSPHRSSRSNDSRSYSS